MNGAEALTRTLVECGVEICFANPGTSEMQLVAALDSEPKMRAILGLFEGVVTGAADGYGRMADKPAATLLHLGPGLANGGANLHNAKRARSPIVNIVGDHATYHLQYDAPLTSDIDGLAHPVSDWVARSTSPSNLAALGADAIAAALAYPGAVATLIAPADHAWTDGAEPAAARARPAPLCASDDAIAKAASALKADGAKALFLGGRALREEALFQAGRIAAATGARLIAETFSTRLQRGEGRVPIERLPYFGEWASGVLKDMRAIVLTGAQAPVAFFAYPDKPSTLWPDSADMVEFASPRIDALDALTRLADALQAPAAPANVQGRLQPPREAGKLSPAGVAAALCELMPEDAIVSDESATAGLMLFPMTQGARKHDWMSLMGGAIGQGLPVAIGAAVACPDRQVIALQADGGGMYTLQALWTAAREQLDVIAIILNNGSYAILNIELQRVGVANPGPKALSLLDLKRPELKWTALAEGMGVPAVRADTAEAFREALAAALARKGPSLIDAVIA
jgi:acetolactate synthase I/II/III large subunit